MTKILSILQGENNKILRNKSVELTDEEIKSEEIQQLIKNMAITMLKKDGAGLAAPQVGKNIRLFVVETKDGSLVFINPKITRKSFKKEIDTEGCLSLPDIWGKVKRSYRVKVEFIDKNGNKQSLKAQGLLARVIQHESDHLDGILFIDKLEK